MTDGPDTTADIAYLRYLQSTAWRRTRSAALMRAGNRCAIDAAHTEGLEVVHSTRERLGYELEQDLVVLCTRCRQVLAAAAEAEREAASSRQNVIVLRRVATADGASAEVAEPAPVTDITETWATVQSLPVTVTETPVPPPDLVPAAPRYRPWTPSAGSVAPPPASRQPEPPDDRPRGPRRKRRLI